MRLLIVEDEEMLGSSLKQAFEEESYGVDWAKDGETALQFIETHSFSLIILDINLPKLSGLDVLRKMRAQRNITPVLILTARDTPLHKVEGLDNGADDYIVKPFDLNELFARVRSLIRRSEGRAHPTIVSRDIELDIAAKSVTKSGSPVLLTAKEFRILKTLMERSGRFVTKADLEYALYSADEAVESNAIEVTIYNLRKKLGTDFIQTIRGVGYMVAK